MRRNSLIGFILLSLFASLTGAAKSKVLYVDSYHEGYAWSDGITEGIKSVLGDKAEFRIYRMDTKRHTDEAFMTQAVTEVKSIIESWQPDVVIASDDNASKFVIKPYYSSSKLPFVFCGVNWDASAYGFPTDNICGMEEVTLIEPLLLQLKKYAKGDKIGFLTVDNITGHREAENIQSKFNLVLEQRYAKTFEQWKEAFNELQVQSDMIILENNSGLEGWIDDEAKAFVEANTKVPTGVILEHMTPFGLVGYTKSAAEQGEWAAAAALRILNGESPKDIGVTQNKKGQLYINMKVAQKLGVRFPLAVIKMASRVD